MADLELDYEGIGVLLKSTQMRDIIHATAERVAAGVRGQKPEADVAVDDYVTDRTASGVTVRNPQARTWQARDGVLTRAAAAEGLEVTER